MAGQLYVSNHRRHLPQGRMLTVPSVLSLELDINKNFRTLRKRGEDIIRAVQLWYRLFARTIIPSEEEKIELDGASPRKKRTQLISSNNNRHKPSNSIWNMKAEDISKPTFTSVYTSELDSIIQQIDRGQMDMRDIAESLRAMKSSTETQVVGRRPIPGTLPSDKLIYNACVALAVIGSPPCAMTFSDSKLLNLPKPVAPANTHKIKISLKRVLDLLTFLKVIPDTVEGWDLIARIRLLWKEAGEYGVSDQYRKNSPSDSEMGRGDIMELGVLRWMLFGIEANQPTWFEQYCMPCGKGPPKNLTLDHPLVGNDLRRTNGELVKHDPKTCPLCRSMTGCPYMVSEQCVIIDQQQQQPNIEVEDDVNIIETEEEDDEQNTNANHMSPAHVASNQVQTIQLQFPPADYGDASMPPKIYRMHLDDKVEIQTSRTF